MYVINLGSSWVENILKGLQSSCRNLVTSLNSLLEGSVSSPQYQHRKTTDKANLVVAFLSKLLKQHATRGFNLDWIKLPAHTEVKFNSLIQQPANTDWLSF